MPHHFNPKKDYYATLGVMSDAEDIVITAAYRALVSRYHPDRWTGDKNIAHTKTAEINEAYGVLSNKEAKAEYDKLREKSNSYGETTAQESEIDELLAELEDRWQVAASIYPDLTEIRQQLKKTAHRLAFSYVVFLLETKKFKERHQVAQEMEKVFLELHFGKNQEIIDFAKLLIGYGFKDAIKALNRTIDVLGDETDAGTIISQIKQNFDIDKKIREIRVAQGKREDNLRISELKKLVREREWETDAITLVRELGYRFISTEGGFFSPRKVQIIDPHTEEVLYEGKTSYEATQWVVRNLATS